MYVIAAPLPVTVATSDTHRSELRLDSRHRQEGSFPGEDAPRRLAEDGLPDGPTPVEPGFSAIDCSRWRLDEETGQEDTEGPLEQVVLPCSTGRLTECRGQV